MRRRQLLDALELAFWIGTAAACGWLVARVAMR